MKKYEGGFFIEATLTSARQSAGEEDLRTRSGHCLHCLPHPPHADLEAKLVLSILPRQMEIMM